MLHDKYGVYVATSYDEFVGKVDGIIITARHGDNHYQYAKPYLQCGLPMYIVTSHPFHKSCASEVKASQIANMSRDV